MDQMRVIEHQEVEGAGGEPSEVIEHKDGAGLLAENLITI
jgi:hypothetical protein